MTSNQGGAYTVNTAAIPGSRSRVLQLDILRGVAILLVIAAHTWHWSAGSGLLAVPAHCLVRVGWSGVDLFFVLSGFLIGNLLFSEIKAKSALNVKRFLIRRGFKIWPLYFLYLLFVFVMLIGENPDHSVRRALNTIWPNLLHIQNYIVFDERLLHTWSLAVEEHFYLALPFLLWLFWRKNPRAALVPLVPYTAFALSIICTLGRIARYYSEHSPSYLVPASWTHLRIDALFWGVMLAYYHSFQPQVLQRFIGTPRKRAALFLFGLLCLTPAIIMKWGQPFLATLGITMVYIGYGSILLATVYTPIGQGRGGRLLATPVARMIAWIGFYSYPIYLWHIEAGQMPIVWLTHRHFLGFLNDTVRWWGLTFLFALFAIAAGALVGILVERPTLALRDKLFPSSNNKPVELPAVS